MVQWDCLPLDDFVAHPLVYMVQVYLLKDYKENSKGDIIQVSNNVAFGLEEQGTARRAVNKDYTVKPEIGESKAFRSSPSRQFIRRREKKNY